MQRNRSKIEEKNPSPHSMNELILDMLVAIASFLRPQDVVRFGLASTYTQILIKRKNADSSVDQHWKQKFDLHFGYKNLKNKNPTNWFTTFIEYHQSHYPKYLTPKVIKFFSIVKQGDVESFIKFAKGNRSLKYLSYQDEHIDCAVGHPTTYWAARNHHQAILDCFYSMAILPNINKKTGTLNLFTLDRKGNSILHSAVKCRRNPYDIDALIKSGADVNFGNKRGARPLHIAAQNGDSEIIKILLENNADINIKTNDSRTPLYFAVEESHVDAVKLLLEKNADYSDSHLLNIATENKEFNFFNILLASNANIDVVYDYGFTLSHIAAKNGQLDILKVLLIKNNADIHKLTSYEGNALNLAVKNRHIEIVKLLLEKNVQPNIADNNGYIPLHWAIKKGRLDIFNILLTHNADIQKITCKKGSALNLAVENNQIEMIKSLLEKNFPPDSEDECGTTPLLIAIRNGWVDIINLLLTLKADIHKITHYGSNALHFAVSNGHLETVKLLLEKNVQINCQDRWGETPLHTAIKYGRVDIANLLLNHIDKDSIKQELSEYLKKRSDLKAPEYNVSFSIFGHTFGFGKSKTEKVAAASMFKCVIEGADRDNLTEHLPSLNDGELGKIYNKFLHPGN